MNDPIIELDVHGMTLPQACVAIDAALRRAIRETTGDMTVFIVSQRVSTVKRADLLLVLDDGELKGVGTHEQLLADCPVYREICASQEKGGATA